MAQARRQTDQVRQVRSEEEVWQARRKGRQTCGQAKGPWQLWHVGEKETTSFQDWIYTTEEMWGDRELGMKTAAECPKAMKVQSDGHKGLVWGG